MRSSRTSAISIDLKASAKAIHPIIRTILKVVMSLRHSVIILMSQLKLLTPRRNIKKRNQIASASQD